MVCMAQVWLAQDIFHYQLANKLGNDITSFENSIIILVSNWETKTITVKFVFALDFAVLSYVHWIKDDLALSYYSEMLQILNVHFHSTHRKKHCKKTANFLGVIMQNISLSTV